MSPAKRISKQEQRERSALKERVEQLFDGWGAHSRFARGLGVERSTLLRIYTGDTAEVPGYIEATLELLEQLPEEKWPKRWKKGDAD